MILEILGVIHIIHYPLLIIYPFVIIHQILDIYYITYFFFIFFSYTFINGENPISFISKIIENKINFPEKKCENKINFPEKKCENKINFPEKKCENKINFPEIESILPTRLYPFINHYFIIISNIYLFSLFIVVYRNNLYHIVFFPFFILFIYFLFINKLLATHLLQYFILVQQFTKFTLLFTIYFLLEKQCYIPFHPNLRN
jgi:hypothetical protein